VSPSLFLTVTLSWPIGKERWQFKLVLKLNKQLVATTMIISFLDTQVSKLVGWLVGWSVRHTFGFPISGQ